jgi:hypothetical protein
MQAIARARYRGRQFFSSLRPRVDASLRAEAHHLLSESERALFASMTRHDQQHCLEVYRRLRDEGHHERDLLIAALLHDVGKGRVALWHRVAFVLLDSAAPHALDRIATPGDGRGYREALYRCRHHAEIGARLAQEAGSSNTVIALIRDEGSHELQAALSRADDAS